MFVNQVRRPYEKNHTKHSVLSEICDPKMCLLGRGIVRHSHERISGGGQQYIYAHIMSSSTD